MINKRSAGVLLHITSLPSSFGIGDIGPEAFRFADFLHRSKQTYWQLLPLTPIEKGQGYSPYSSTSSMAGNTLLISPESLRDLKLLSDRDLDMHRIPNTGKVKYGEATSAKETLFEKAYQKFLRSGSGSLKEEFNKFKKTEKYWLDDYALYVVLKSLHDSTPWYEWPEQFKLRETQTLKKVVSSSREQIEKVKWLQFIFLQQWLQLKGYCNERGIQLFGDLPFYVSYDSSDVWSSPEIFALDKKRNITGVAGVPPDYFNADGQLWGMPVFRWQVLKKQNYDWWILRLKKNVQLFDVVRLDHFRAFADYWEVPAGESTAKNGTWKPGPGAAFFKAVQKALGELPFIAEDLGDINQPVFDLRDQFKFPGMKVLQFAFGDNTGKNDYIPHNYTENFVAYTGTHDNNTTVGWFKKEVSDKDKMHVSTYLGRTIDGNNIHLELGRIAYSSVAKAAILPMQDILGLDETARINTPASTSNNWEWRLKNSQFPNRNVEKRLSQWVSYYNRGVDV